MSTNERRQAFQIEVLEAWATSPDDQHFRVSVVACHQSSSPQIATPDGRLPELSPSRELSEAYADGRADRHEFLRRYLRELEHHSEQCEWLRSKAGHRGLALMVDDDDASRCAAYGMKRHMEHLECQHRWKAGLMIGGYVYPVREKIRQAGGLWFARHKTWMMPDRESWQYIQSLLPGDF